MRVLLVGLGRWGEKHLRVLREIGATVWVADPDPARRRWASAQGGVPEAQTVADYREAVSRVDAVDIVTPADSHRAIALEALAAGRHCFVEKPLAVSAADGQRLAEAAMRAGRVLQVGHIFRFHPVTAALRGALDAGRIGPVRYATARFSGFKRPRTDVGITHTDAIHYFDLFAHLLGRAATHVQALQRDFLGRGLDDMSVTIVTYGDVPVVVEASYFEPTSRRECLIVGERAALAADYGAGTVTLHAGEHRRRGDAWEAVDTGKEDVPAVGAEPLRVEVEAFVAACAGQAPNPVPAEAGVLALQVVEAAARSGRDGRRVSL